MWWMLAFTVVLYPIMLRGMRITRAEGAILLSGYAVYLWVLL